MYKRWDFTAGIERPAAIGICVIPGWQIDIHIDITYFTLYTRISWMPSRAEQFINRRFISLRNKCLLKIRHIKQSTKR